MVENLEKNIIDLKSENEELRKKYIIQKCVTNIFHKRISYQNRVIKHLNRKRKQCKCEVPV